MTSSPTVRKQQLNELNNPQLFENVMCVKDNNKDSTYTPNALDNTVPLIWNKRNDIGSTKGK